MTTNDSDGSFTPRRHFLKVGALLSASIVLPRATHAEAFKLPELPFPADALEPHIDSMTMQIHHDKHHGAYVAKLNAALDSDSTLSSKGLDELLSSLPAVEDEAKRTTIRNNGGGHWNHDFFWKILTPSSKSGKPSGELSKALESAFRSMDAFRTAFNTAATGRFGSGWAWLILREGKLAITSTPNQDNPMMTGIVAASDLGTPLLGLDVWEHAYYLKYQNRRADYVAAWWNVVNWEEVSRRFAGS